MDDIMSVWEALYMVYSIGSSMTSYHLVMLGDMGGVRSLTSLDQPVRWTALSSRSVRHLSILCVGVSTHPTQWV